MGGAPLARGGRRPLACCTDLPCLGSPRLPARVVRLRGQSKAPTAWQVPPRSPQPGRSKLCACPVRLHAQTHSFHESPPRAPHHVPGTPDRDCSIVISVRPDADRDAVRWDSKFLQAAGDYTCPAGYRLVKYEEADTWRYSIAAALG